MRFELPLADLGEGMARAEISQWLVAVGDTVRVDQPVVVVETDKMQVELPTSVAGEVLELGGAEGDTIAVGEPIMYIRVADASPEVDAGSGDERLDAPGPAREAAPVAPDPPAQSMADGATSAGRVRAAPAVRKLALERGVDIQGLTGSGPGGRVTQGDVLAVVAAPGTTLDVGVPAPRGRVPLRGMRRTIAENVTKSWRRIPQAVDLREVDATRLLQARRAAADWAGPDGSISILALMVKIVGLALARHPLSNSWLDEERGEIVVEDAIHVGIAMATDDGLVVPVVHSVPGKTAAQIAAEIAGLAVRARERALTADDLRGGTFTVNNTGALSPIGAGHPLPLINWPQAAILAFGRIEDRVVAVDGQPVVRPTMLLTVNADHRIVDGAELVAFTNDVVRLVGQPDRLLGGLG